MMQMNHSFRINRKRGVRLFLTLLELARFDRPIGILAILFPYLYGFLYANLTTERVIEREDSFNWRILLVCVSGVLLRAVGCVWNDIVDVEIDRHVQRTRNRPLARGAVSISTAYCYTAFLLGGWSLALLPLVPDPRCLVRYSTPLLLMVIIYPYTKRVTNYAQVFLGFTLGWGVVFGAAMGGLDIFQALVFFTTGEPLEPGVQGVFALYAACIIWTVIYDTIYGFQDVADDRRIGVKSTAIRFHQTARLILAILSCIQIVLLIYAGEKLAILRGERYESLFGSLASIWPYTALTVVATALYLLIALLKVDLESPQSCSLWFKMLSVTVGSSIGAGLWLQYLATPQIISTTRSDSFEFLA